MHVLSYTYRLTIELDNNVFAKATYSASQVEMATVGCFLNFHEIRSGPPSVRVQQ
jgi:hypothetical protein